MATKLTGVNLRKSGYLSGILFLAAVALLGPTIERAEANSGHCLAASGESVTNTCGFVVNIAWREPSGWKAWFLDPGETTRLPGLVRAVDVYACDTRRGGVAYSNGRPVGCR